jgi:hypothetical protein
MTGWGYAPITFVSNCKTRLYAVDRFIQWQGSIDENTFQSTRAHRISEHPVSPSEFWVGSFGELLPNARVLFV